MSDRDSCEVCGTEAESAEFPTAIQQRCPRCGEFKLPHAVSTRRLYRKDKVKLSGWVRDQNALGEVPELTQHRIGLVVASPSPGVVERAERLLSYAVKGHNRLGERFNINGPAFLSVTYSDLSSELMYLAQFLLEEGLINRTAPKGEFEITPHGHMRYEALQTQPSASAQGFVAMWFDESMREVYARGFELGVRQAGYDSLRVDRVEHVGKIDDEIIAQIRRSRFLVADFTAHRAGVYFEAGFALGLNLPVIWSCRRDHIGELHFDIRQFNCIDWTDPAELADRLQKRIEAIIGSGPRKPVS